MPLSLLSRHLTTTTTTTTTVTKLWRLLRSHSPPPSLETTLSNSNLIITPSLISSFLSSTPSPSSNSDHLLSLRFFLYSSTLSHLHLPPSTFALASQSILLPSSHAHAHHPHLLHSLLDSYLSENSPLPTLKTFKSLLLLLHLSPLPFPFPFALSLLRRMQGPHFHILPDVPIFNSVLRLPSTPSSAAFSILHHMKHSGLKPDIISYVTVIKKLCNDGNVGVARRVLETMTAEGCPPNVVVWSTMLDGACGVSDMGAALGILEEMERGEGANVVTYTCLMKCFCENGKLEEALGVVERMGRKGVRPNRVTLRTLIKGFCDKGRVNDAYKVVEGLVSDEGSVTSEECYSLLVVSLLGVGDMEGAEGLLKRMMEWGVRPDGLACNALLREFCGKGRFLDGYRWVGVLEENGVSCVDSDVYSSLLAGLCEDGHLVEAVKLGRRVVENGMRIGDTCVGSVVEAMVKVGEADLASEIRRLREESDGLNVC